MFVSPRGMWPLSPPLKSNRTSDERGKGYRGDGVSMCGSERAYSSAKNRHHPKPPRQEEEEFVPWHPTLDKDWVEGAGGLQWNWKMANESLCGIHSSSRYWNGDNSKQCNIPGKSVSVRLCLQFLSIFKPQFLDFLFIILTVKLNLIETRIWY